MLLLLPYDLVQYWTGEDEYITYSYIIVFSLYSTSEMQNRIL
jgi:hypothetical protein